MSTLTVAFLIYVFTRIDAFAYALASAMQLALFSFGIAVVVLGVMAFVYSVDDDPIPDIVFTVKDKLVKYAKWVVLLVLLNAAMPTQKDLAFIVGGALGYEGVTTLLADERIKQTGGKAYDALDRWLDSVAAEAMQQKQESEPEPEQETTE